MVSGRPLLSMPPRKVIAILLGAFRTMGPDGAFYQLTYGPRCPVPPRLLKHLGLEAHRIGGTLANLPPASVYRLRLANTLSGGHGRRPYSLVNREALS